ncbi:MAG TPA: sigma-70 family RNA polymerase sigma factor [Gemmataceae bacterium]|nr:sigma-70 family RNA polymerase sigma factor [Gemmataceae bacterium]
MSEPAGGVAQWLPAARAGSREALGKVLEAARQYLLTIARQEFDPDLRAKNSPSDVVQETFVEAQRDFGQFQGDTEDELLAWLRQLLLHRVGKLRRRYGTQKRRLAREVALGGDDSSSGLAGGLTADTLSPSGQAMEHEQDEVLQAALARLPEDYRRVITLRYEEQLPFEEIGRLLQRSPDAARKLWARAVERLHEELDVPP